MKTLKYLFLERLYEVSKIPYRSLFKRKTAWSISVKDLLAYDQKSLGYHLGCFLLKHHFTLEPQLEDHDVFHVLTNSGISVPEEIEMQFYLFGNGKRSAYLFTVLIIGSVLFMGNFPRFKRAYARGRSAHTFYHLDFLKLLPHSLNDLQQTFKILPI